MKSKIPNGIRIRNGKLYVTQSSLSQIKDPSGLLVSGVYCFDMNDRDIAVTNTSADQNLLTTVITKNPEVQYGLDGIVFNEAGDLFVGNFGDGAIHRIKMDAEGKVVSNDVWAQDTTQLRTTDGMYAIRFLRQKTCRKTAVPLISAIRKCGNARMAPTVV